jgi:hypothetical protein
MPSDNGPSADAQAAQPNFNGSNGMQRLNMERFEIAISSIFGAEQGKELDVFAKSAKEAMQCATTVGLLRQYTIDRLYQAAQASGIVRIYGDDLVQATFSEALLAPAASNVDTQSAASRIRVGNSSWRQGAISANDLQKRSFAPVSYVLPGLIPEGITIIAGKPKIGKSWLVLDLGIAIAAARFTLGTLKPAQGDVIYLALEDGKRRLKERITKLLGSGLSWPARLTLQTDWKRVNAGALEDIKDWCASVREPKAVIIDTLEKIRPLQNGYVPAYSADYRALADLQKFANENGIAVILNHHVRKMDAEDPFDTVSGTLGLTGVADTILVLKRQNGRVTLYARGRDIEETETALQFDKTSCKWTILGDAAEVHRSSERASIIRALNNSADEGMTVREIMLATGSRNRNATDLLLFKMRAQGDVVRVRRGMYALPEDGKIGQKDGHGGQDPKKSNQMTNVINLSDLSAHPFAQTHDDRSDDEI